jgi:hypothetical protein
MHPLQGPTGKDKSMASDYSGQSKNRFWWVGPLAVVSTYVGAYMVASLVLDRELLRLKGLHFTINLLHRIAEEAGTRGIKLEDRYNDIVNAMH